MPPKKMFPLKVFGIETEAPRWVIVALAVILVAAVAGTLYNKIWSQPEQQILSLKEANQQLASEIQEYSVHSMENPEKHELFEEADGKLLLRIFKDHCVLIQRQTLRGTRTKLVMDLAKGPADLIQPPPKLSSFLGLFPALEASAGDAPPMPVAAPQPNACQRGCLNPHPGEFRWWYGQRHGQWVEVWRQWPDGCQHVQMLNVEHRTWDSNPDGSAKVRWSCCVH
jgi:hypothetical protein